MKTHLAIIFVSTFNVFHTALASDLKAGEGKAKQYCAACHGMDGVGLAPIYPNIAGQKKSYISKQLSDFKSGKRQDPTMKGMASLLTPLDIENLAEYYAQLPAKK